MDSNETGARPRANPGANVDSSATRNDVLENSSTEEATSVNDGVQEDSDEDEVTFSLTYEEVPGKKKNSKGKSA